MSHVATAWAYRQHIDQGPKFVLVALADFADENGTCYPGQDRIARMTGMHRSSVVRHLKTLEELGLVSRTRRATTGGFRTSDRYVLHLGTNVAESNVAPSNVAETNVADSADLSRNLSEPTSQSATGTVREPPENRKEGTRKRGTRIPSDFRPTADLLAWAIEECPDLNIDEATAEFVDYWLGVPGQKGVKLDWPATWRNDMRKKQKWAATSRPQNETGTGFWNRGIA